MAPLADLMFRSRWLRAGCRVALVVACSTAARAQSVSTSAAVPASVIAREPGGQATVRATRLASPLRVDGRLDDPVYETVGAMSDFLQAEPRAGEPATQKTEVWLFFDDRNLYVSARCWETEPGHEVVREMRRDILATFTQGDSFGFAFDTFHDRRNGYQFSINTIGGRIDAQTTDERQFNSDWNPIWNFSTARFPGGWTVEAVVPFASLRYPPGRAQVWGFQAKRIYMARNEYTYLTQVPAQNASGGLMQISAAATMTDLEAPTHALDLELKPYAISTLRSDASATPAISNDLGGAIGLDAKYGITRNLSADLTVNTDFAQVEADSQQINLTRFNLFFPEKRDFFLENQGTFTFGGANAGASTDMTPILFYSRRIGLSDGRLVPIRAGGRMSGRMGQYEIGLLDIQTGRESIQNLPATNFSALRVRRSVLRKSSVGAIVTGRSMSQNRAGANQVFGVDARLAFFASLAINAYWARSSTDGQASGNHDSHRAQLDFAGDRYGVQLERLSVGAGFNPDVGFVPRPDMRRSYASFRFSPRPRWHPSIRKVGWTGSLNYIENGAGQLETRQPQAEFAVDMQNGDRYSLAYRGSHEMLVRPFRIAPGYTIAPGSYDFASLLATAAVGRRAAVGATMSLERGTFYDGRKTTLQVSQGNVNLARGLLVEPTLSVNHIDIVAGRFTTSLAGSRVTYAVNPRMFASALLQYNTSSHTVSTNARLRWEYQPGSELFVVFNDERSTLASAVSPLINRAFTVKITRWLRM